MFSFVKTVKQPICKAFIEFTFRHIPLNFSLYLLIPGLVLSTALAEEVKTLPGFQPFSYGYVWQPYKGEVYNPLMTSPELKNKLDELLAVS